MFKVSVMYPNQEGARFDIDYYRTKHMELVRKHLEPFGLVRTEVLKGISGTGGHPRRLSASATCISKPPTATRKGLRLPQARCVPIFPISRM